MTLKTTGNPQRSAKLVRGGIIQTNIPKAYRHSQEAHRAFEDHINKTVELANTLTRIAACVGAFLLCAAIVLLLVVVGTL